METRNKKVTLDIEKQYPNILDLQTIHYKDKIIIVSVRTANWIILNNEEELRFFQLLRNSTIKSALASFGTNQQSINVLTQIEAKAFFSTENKSSQNGQKSMHIYLTNGCNLRCPHCYMYAGERLPDELNTDEVKKLLSDFSEHGGINVTFSGGEISTRLDLMGILRYAHSLNLQVSILTNGTLWTSEAINEASRFINNVQISIDGYDEASNARVRGANNFQKSLSAVRQFARNNVKTEVSIVPFFSNTLESEMEQYVTFAKQLTQLVPGLTIRFATELLDGRNLHLSEKQKKWYSEIVTSIYSQFYGEDMNDYPFIQQRKEHHILNNCMFGELAISANGSVYPCSRIVSTKPLGNIRNDSFEKILSAAHKAELFSEISNLKPCKDCELMYICGGGCRIEFFPELLSIDYTKIKDVEISPRTCSEKIKEHFYELMIRTNKHIYQ